MKESIEISRVINDSPISRQQIAVFLLCFLIVAIDGFDTSVIGFLAPAIAGEWNVDPTELTPLFGAGMLGSVVGSIFFGPVADMIGRKRTMLLGAVTFGGFTLLSGQVNSLTLLTALRFLAGIGLGGVLPCAIALTSEYSPDRRRSLLVTTMFCGYTLGAASGGFIAAWMVPEFGWRMVLIAGGLAPLLLAPIAWVLLPESLSYLVAKNIRFDEVGRILSRMVPGLQIEGMAFSGEVGPKAPPARALFEARPFAGTLLLWTTAFMGLMVVYLLANWMPLLLTGEGYSLRQASLVTAMFQIGGTTGAILIGLLMDRYKPNRVLATAFLFASVLVASIGLLAGWPIAAAAVIFLAGFCIPGGQVGASAYAAAWYPTHVRATGISWMSGCGRIGSILGSVSGGALLALGFGMPAILALLGIPMLIAAAAMFLHERVHGSPMPESAGMRALS